jgi:hypothetical protein
MLKPGPGTPVANLELEKDMYTNTDSYQSGVIKKTGNQIYI